MSLFNIIVDIAAKTASFESGIDRIDKRLEAWGDNVKRIGEFVVASAFAELTKKVVENGDKMLTLANRAGATAQAFSELAYASKQNGVSQEALSKSLTQMNRALSLAATGSKDQRDALAALGLTAKDFIGLDTDKKFELIADRVSKLTDEGDKARAEMILLGRAGADLGPLFQKGADGIRAAREESRQVGASFTESQLKTLEEANKSIERMSAAWDGLATRLVSKVAPTLESVFDKITALISGDKLLKLKEQIDSLKGFESEGEGFLSLGYGDMGWGFYSASQVSELRRKKEEQLRIAQYGLQTHSRGSISSGSGQNFTGDLPGFLSDIEPFAVTAQKAIIGGGRGVNPLLQQWEEDTRTSLDSIGEQYKKTKEQIEDLFREGVITPETYAERMQEAWQKFENASYISPVQITQRLKPLSQYLDAAEQNVHQFTLMFKSSLQSAFDQGGAAGKNFVRNLISALSSQALSRAIASVGEQLSAALNKAGGGGVIGGFLQSLFGAGAGDTGEIAPVSITQSYVPAYASGTSYVPRTGLAMLHEGEAVLTRAENSAGGRGLIIAPVYNIDARGATQDVIAALPAILQQTSDQTVARVADMIQRKKIKVPT